MSEEFDKSPLPEPSKFSEWEKIVFLVSTSRLIHRDKILTAGDSFYEKYLAAHQDIPVLKGSSKDLHFSEGGGCTDPILETEDVSRMDNTIGGIRNGTTVVTTRVRNIHFPNDQEHLIFGDVNTHVIDFKGKESTRISGELHTKPFTDNTDRSMHYRMHLDAKRQGSIEIEIDMGNGRYLFLAYACDETGKQAIGNGARWSVSGEEFTRDELASVLQEFGFM